MVKAHVVYLVFTIYRQRIAEVEDKTIREHLEHVAVTFALDSLVKDSVAVFDAGFFGRGTGVHLNQALATAITKLRPFFIPLAESFYVPDHNAPSSIGNSYGDIYELQLELAQNSRLNKEEVPAYFDKLIKPILKGKL
jgi:hypothetical protein